jgi:hypothetical protein
VKLFIMNQHKSIWCTFRRHSCCGGGGGDDDDDDDDDESETGTCTPETSDCCRCFNTRSEQVIVSFVDFLLSTDVNGKIKTQLYDKTESFQFLHRQPRKNPLSPRYGVYVSQMIHQCLNRGRATDKLDDLWTLQ